MKLLSQPVVDIVIAFLLDIEVAPFFKESDARHPRNLVELKIRLSTLPGPRYEIASL